MFNTLNERCRISTRSSLYPQLSLNSIKRALSTKWVRTAIHSLYCNTEFGLSCRAEDIMVGEFGKGQYIKFSSPRMFYSFKIEEEISLIMYSSFKKFHSNSNNYPDSTPQRSEFSPSIESSLTVPPTEDIDIPPTEEIAVDRTISLVNDTIVGGSQVTIASSEQVMQDITESAPYQNAKWRNYLFRFFIIYFHVILLLFF